MQWPWFSKTSPTARVGKRGERLAARFLSRQGYQVLARNVHYGRYEIDIIAREGDTLAFVEVKTRRSGEIALPEQNITSAKQRHIRQAAYRYIADHPEPDVYYRFDVVSIVIPEKGKPEITLFRDAFSA